MTNDVAYHELRTINRLITAHQEQLGDRLRVVFAIGSVLDGDPFDIEVQGAVKMTKVDWSNAWRIR